MFDTIASVDVNNFALINWQHFAVLRKKNKLLLSQNVMSILIIETTEGAIKNEQPRETGNIVHEPDVSMVRNGMHHTDAANCFFVYK